MRFGAVLTPSVLPTSGVDRPEFVRRHQAPVITRRSTNSPAPTRKSASGIDRHQSGFRCQTFFVADGGWFEYDRGDIALLRRRRHQPFRLFHMMELNGVGWLALSGTSVPLAALLLFVAHLSLWLAISASVLVTVAIAIALDRRKEAATWVGRSTDLTETELLTVVAELLTLGIEVELSRQIIHDSPESSDETELILRHRHRDRRAVERALAKTAEMDSIPPSSTPHEFSSEALLVSAGTPISTVFHTDWRVSGPST